MAYAFIFSLMQATSLSRLTAPHFITLITFREENTWRLCSFLQLAIGFTDINILLSILLSDILNICFSLRVRDDIHTCHFSTLFHSIDLLISCEGYKLWRFRVCNFLHPCRPWTLQIITFSLFQKILWHVDPLLGNGGEGNTYKLQPLLDNGP
jgi:hypothetical protein